MFQGDLFLRTEIAIREIETLLLFQFNQQQQQCDGWIDASGKFTKKNVIQGLVMIWIFLKRVQSAGLEVTETSKVVDYRNERKPSCTNEKQMEIIQTAKSQKGDVIELSVALQTTYENVLDVVKTSNIPNGNFENNLMQIRPYNISTVLGNVDPFFLLNAIIWNRFFVKLFEIESQNPQLILDSIQSALESNKPMTVSLVEDLQSHIQSLTNLTQREIFKIWSIDYREQVEEIIVKLNKIKKYFKTHPFVNFPVEEVFVIKDEIIDLKQTLRYSVETLRQKQVYANILQRNLKLLSTYFIKNVATKVDFTRIESRFNQWAKTIMGKEKSLPDGHLIPGAYNMVGEKIGFFIEYCEQVVRDAPKFDAFCETTIEEIKNILLQKTRDDGDLYDRKKVFLLKRFLSMKVDEALEEQFSRLGTLNLDAFETEMSGTLSGTSNTLDSLIQKRIDVVVDGLYLGNLEQHFVVQKVYQAILSNIKQTTREELNTFNLDKLLMGHMMPYVLLTLNGDDPKENLKVFIDALNYSVKKLKFETVEIIYKMLQDARIPLQDVECLNEYVPRVDRTLIESAIDALLSIKDFELVQDVGNTVSKVGRAGLKVVGTAADGVRKTAEVIDEHSDWFAKGVSASIFYYLSTYIFPSSALFVFFLKLLPNTATYIMNKTLSWYSNPNPAQNKPHPRNHQASSFSGNTYYVENMHVHGEKQQPRGRSQKRGKVKAGTGRSKTPNRISSKQQNQDEQEEQEEEEEEEDEGQLSTSEDEGDENPRGRTSNRSYGAKKGRSKTPKPRRRTSTTSEEKEFSRGRSNMALDRSLFMGEKESPVNPIKIRAYLNTLDVLIKTRNKNKLLSLVRGNETLYLDTERNNFDEENVHMIREIIVGNVADRLEERIENLKQLDDFLTDFSQDDDDYDGMGESGINHEHANTLKFLILRNPDSRNKLDNL